MRGSNAFHRLPLDPWAGCLVAAAITCATLWLRLAMDVQLEGRPTLVMFTVPIMLSAFVGGLWAGLLSTLLTYLLASYFLLAPIGSFEIASAVERWQQFFIVLAGIVISALNEALHRVRASAQQALRERERSREELLQAGVLHGKRLAGIVDSAMDAIISIDSSQHVLLFNAAAERMFGCTAAAVIGTPLDRFVPERFRAEHAGYVASFGRTGVTSRSMRSLGALMGLRSDGSEFPIEASISQIEIGGHTVFTVILRDITERTLAERRLRESEDRLQAITEKLSEGLIVSDMAGRVLHWNRAGLEMHDFSDLQEGLRKLPDFATTFEVRTLAGDLVPLDRWPLARLLRGEEVRSVECLVRRLDQPWERILSFSGAIVQYADDQQMAFLSISDITAQHQASARMQDQLQRLRLLDQITRAIAERQDLKSIYQVAVRTLEDQLSADFSCMLSHEAGSDSLLVTSVGVQSAGSLLEHGTSLPIDASGLSRCLAGDLMYEPDTTSLPLPLLQHLAAIGLRSLVAAPLQSESRVFGILVSARRAVGGFSSGECEFIRQLSAHVALAAHQAQLHGDLQSAFDELRQTQQAVMQQERLRALGQMASGIAHDINNAITPAVLYAENLLEHEPLSEHARSYLQSIARAVDDVAATVARMREFYRSREPQLHTLPLALNELVAQVVELSRARWSDMPQQRGVVIEVVQVLAESLPQVLGVESEIREALINLVFNAVDAMPDGGVLTLRTRYFAPEAPKNGDLPRPHGRVALEVSDSGVGMDEATRRRCLEPFFTTKGERGTGLGLAMVYGTAQRHGAEIEIESSPGHGTLVRLAFALQPEIAPTALRPVSKSTARLRLLLVDDDPVLLHALRNTLENEGHIAQTSAGGRDGIEAFAAACDAGEPHDVVITDLGMPHVDGRSVAAAVKRRSPSTPVVLLTGWGQRMDEDGEARTEVDLVLGKPPRLSELREALAKCRPAAGE